ncbi:MAG TPA: type II CAAX endopeptidase family protein [Bacillota bacterium]|nr:type II CAAX endopeptidase family protein [Bacillota bacterium]
MSEDSSSVPLVKLSAYAGVKWGPVRGLIAVVVSYIVAQFVALGALLLVTYFTHMSNSHARHWLNSTFGQFVFIVLAEGFTVLLLWLMLRKRITFKSLGFTRRPRLSDPLWAIVAGMAYYVLLIIVTVLAGWLAHIPLDQKQEIGFDTVTTNLDKILTFVSLVILPPLVEETLFRGVLFSGLRKKLPFIWSALLVSVAFAIPHLLEGKGGLLWVGGIDTFLLSIALCILREYTGSLWASIVLHMLKNGIAYLYLFIFISK